MPVPRTDRRVKRSTTAVSVVLGIHSAFTFVDIVISATFGDTTARLVCPALERGKEQSLQKNMTP